MIFTHCGKMGDVIQLLPIMSAYYKNTGQKAKLCLANFPYNKEFLPLLQMQECVGDVSYADYTPNMMESPGVVRWEKFRFNPHHYVEFEDKSELYLSFGFRHFPNKNYTDFMAEEHNLAIDWDFTLNIGEKRNKYRGKCVVIDKYANDMLRSRGIKGEYLLERTDMIKNLQLAKGASAVKTCTTGSAVLLLMSGINCTVYGIDNENGNDMKGIHMNLIYNKMPGKATWVSL